MADGSKIGAAELVTILLAERDYHSSHPHEVAIQLNYWIAGAILTVFAALFLKKDALGAFRIFLSKNKRIVFTLTATILGGWILLQIGLSEHTNLHRAQRDRLESAVRDLVTEEEFQSAAFWKKHSELSFFPDTEATFLIAREPDKRTFWSYHDRKIELGGFLIMVSVIGFIILWLVRSGVPPSKAEQLADRATCPPSKPKE